MTKFQHFGIGLAVVYSLLAAVTGGFGTATVLLVGSIVCTAGIGLVLWIPLCIGVGVVTMAAAQWVAQTFGLSAPEQSPRMGAGAVTRQPSVDLSGITQATAQNQIALEDYVRRALLLEHSYEQIVSTLKFRGWNEVEIHQAYETVRNL